MNNDDDYGKGMYRFIRLADLNPGFASRGHLQRPENAPFEVQPGANDPLISTGDNQDMDSLSASLEDLQQPENAPNEVQSGANEPTVWSGDDQENSSSRKRDMGVVSPNLSDAKGKRPRTNFTGESSTSGEPEKTTEEAKTNAVRIKPVTVASEAGRLSYRLDHRKKSVSEMQLDTIRIRNRSKTQWLKPAQLQELMKATGATEAEIQKFTEQMLATDAKIEKFLEELKAMEDEILTNKQVIEELPKDGKLTEAEAMQKLKERENNELKKIIKDLKKAREMFKQICQDTKKIDEKTRELQPFFLDDNNNMLSIEGNTATDAGVTVKQDKYIEDLQSKFSDLENQLYSVDNNKVENHDFLGLEKALDDTTGREVPDHLKLIASRIEKDRGKTAGSAHFSVLVLVCAAIKEMEDSEEFSDWEILKKWAATLNLAKELGFQVGFADRLLKAKLYSYFATQLLKR